MVGIRGRLTPPGLAFASIRLPSQRQGFRRQKVPGQPDLLTSILLNVVRSEIHSLSNTLTRAPVDGEADRAQHIITEPIRISLTAIVSAATDSSADANIVFFTGADIIPRTPSGSTPASASISQILRQAQLSTQIGITGNFRGLSNYSTFWARLQALNSEKTPFEYISDLQVYPDMVFSSIDVERSTAEWIEFSAELEEFRTVGITRDRWLSDDQSDESRDGKDAGTKTTSEVNVENLTPQTNGPPTSSAIEIPT